MSAHGCLTPGLEASGARLPARDITIKQGLNGSPGLFGHQDLDIGGLNRTAVTPSPRRSRTESRMWEIPLELFS